MRAFDEKMNVTIVILTYNHEDYIEDCLNSVKYQSKVFNGENKNRIQLIISDDCSHDSTVKIVKAWKDANEKYFDDVEVIQNNVNLGTCQNWINALEKCSGDYVKAIGGDDLLPPTSIFKIFKYLDEYDLVFGGAYEYVVDKENDANTILHKLKKEYCVQKEIVKMPFFKAIHRSCFINAPATYISKRLLTNPQVINFLREYKYTDDFPQWLKMSEIFKVKYTYLNEVSIIYRRTSKSTYIVRNMELLNERISCYGYALSTCKELLGKLLLKNSLQIWRQMKANEKPAFDLNIFICEYYWLKNYFQKNPYTAETVCDTNKYIRSIESGNV